MRATKRVVLVTTFCLATGCGKTQSDQAPVATTRKSRVENLRMSVAEKSNPADDKPSLPLLIEVERPRRGATFGLPIPLYITIQNSSPQAIWVEKSSLPWNHMRSVKVNVQSSYLEVRLAIDDLAPRQWQMLAPGDQLVGQVDLSDRLYLVAHSSKAERVQLAVEIELLVGDGDRHRLISKVREFDFGELTVEIPANARDEKWLDGVFSRYDPRALHKGSPGEG
jgi:hypothetical protein